MSRHDDLAADEELYSRTTDGRLLCDVCLKTFTDVATLRRHLWLHGTRNYQCSICSKTFSEASIFRQHLKTHADRHATVNYHCELCPAGFSRSIDLREHRKSHTGETPFVCNVCGQSFMFKRMLTTHQKTHQNTLPQEVPQVNETSQITQPNTTHQVLQTVPTAPDSQKNISLRLCCDSETVTSESQSLKDMFPGSTHQVIQTLSGTQAELVQSSLPVQQITSTSTTMPVAMVTAAVRSVDSLAVTTMCKCPLCGRVFAGETDLELHIRSEHTNFVLEQKTGNSTEEAQLSVDVRLECPTCFIEFSHLVDLEAHKMSHESPRNSEVLQTAAEFLGSCQSCGKAGQKLQLVDRRNADREKASSGHQLLCCTICAAAFSMADGSQIIESDQRVVSLCTDCGFTFYGRESLERHNRRFHLRENGDSMPLGPVSHHCELCGDVFYKLNALRGHLRLHCAAGTLGGSALPLNCGVCDRLFGNKDTLQRHMAAHGKMGVDHPSPEGIERGCDWAELVTGPSLTTVDQTLTPLPAFSFIQQAPPLATPTATVATGSGIAVSTPTQWPSMTWTTSGQLLTQNAVNNL